MVVDVDILVASRTSGESSATIIVGLAMRGAACVALNTLVDSNYTMQEGGKFTQPSGSAVAVEVVNLLVISLLLESIQRAGELHTSMAGTVGFRGDIGNFGIFSSAICSVFQCSWEDVETRRVVVALKYGMCAWPGASKQLRHSDLPGGPLHPVSR